MNEATVSRGSFNNFCIDRGGSKGMHREQVRPLSKTCAERLKYSNRAVTLIKQSHDCEAVHNRLTMYLLLYMLVKDSYLCPSPRQMNVQVMKTDAYTVEPHLPLWTRGG